MKRPHSLQVVVGMTVVILLLTGMISVAYLLTSLLYQEAGVQPPVLLAQTINSLLGLLLGFLVVLIVGRVFSSKLVPARMRWSVPIIEALDRIAKGDFSVRIDNNLPDNTLVNELAKSVNSMAAELDATERLRQEFISDVSHEVQSPLTSIRGFAEALRNNHLTSAEADHYLQVIESESLRLSRITDNLLKLASLESKEFRLDLRSYRLDKQIRSLILVYEPQWAGKGIVMDAALDEVTITADEDLLSQVWINLIHNSIKFTPEGGKVSVVLRRRGRNIEFTIADTGVGIPEPDQARVFERFYKVDRARSRSNGGSGLGLSIAKKIVELHHGTVAMASQLGTGTTFTVSLPVA